MLSVVMLTLIVMKRWGVFGFSCVGYHSERIWSLILYTFIHVSKNV